MIRKILSIVVIAILVSTPAFAIEGIGAIYEKTLPQEIYNKVEDYTVSLLMVTSNGIGSCSGTMIYEDNNAQYILTAKHCVDGALEVYVENNLAYRYETSLEDDMALITLKDRIYHKITANLSKRVLRRGDEVYLVGYPNTVKYTTHGKMTTKVRDWIIYDMKVIPGCSGGGIFNEYGQLVGVVWGGYLYAKNENPMKSLGEGLLDVRTFLMKILPQALR